MGIFQWKKSLAVSLCVCCTFFAQQPAVAATLSQWAVSAKATSEYDHYWSASNAIGPPNASQCAISGETWSSETFNEVSSITTTYESAVYPKSISIYQNNVKGAVTKVEISADGTTWTPVYSGDASKATEGNCDTAQNFDDVLTFKISNFPSKVNRIRITIDQSSMDWAYIDAVQLIGLDYKVVQKIPRTSTSILSGRPMKLPILTNMGLKIRWVSLTKATCSISGTSLKATKRGLCQVVGRNSGDDFNEPVKQYRNLTIK